MGKQDKFFRAIKMFIKENLLGLSLGLGLFFLLLFLFTTAAWFKPGILEGGFADLKDTMGNWKYPLWFISAAGLGVCIYLSYTTYKKQTKFNELMDTDSKAEFIKNLDDLEYVAYQLGPKYEEKVWDKKQTFKIK